jgi:hypothetical protein
VQVIHSAQLEKFILRSRKDTTEELLLAFSFVLVVASTATGQGGDYTAIDFPWASSTLDGEQGGSISRVHYGILER